MYDTEALNLLRKVIKNYDNLPQNVQYWMNKVVNRVDRCEQDLRTYLALSKSVKDMNYLNSLKLQSDMSYYVVADKREHLEKFRIYLQVCVPKGVNDFIAFSDKVFLNSYVRQVNDEKYNIDDMIISHRRLQVYCHKNNHMTDKQTAWIQGNLFASDLCDRMIKGSKVLILSEYDLPEVDNLLTSFKLRKINIKNNDMELHGLYNVKGQVITTAGKEVAKKNRQDNPDA